MSCSNESQYALKLFQIKQNIKSIKHETSKSKIFQDSRIQIIKYSFKIKTSMYTRINGVRIDNNDCRHENILKNSFWWHISFEMLFIWLTVHSLQGEKRWMIKCVYSFLLTDNRKRKKRLLPHKESWNYDNLNPVSSDWYYSPC